MYKETKDENIAMAKEIINRKIPLLSNKPNTEEEIGYVLYLEKYNVWSETRTQLRNLERKYLENFKMWCWRILEKIKRQKKVPNEELYKSIGESATFSTINNIT